MKPKKALRKDGANDRTLARDGKRTQVSRFKDVTLSVILNHISQVNPAILKDKSTNKPILQQDSRTSDKITAAATGVGDKRAREIDDAAGQPKVKYRKVEPKRCSSFFENLQRTVNQVSVVIPGTIIKRIVMTTRGLSYLPSRGVYLLQLQMRA